jgi:CysZ protein
MIRALALSIGDLGSRPMLAILVRSLVVTLVIFVLLGIGAAVLLAGADPCGWIGDDSCPLGAGGGGIGAVLMTLLAMWFLFPAVGLGVVTAYMDRAVGAVEVRHYPAAAATARRLGIGRGALLGLGSAARVLIYNLVALPFYIILLVTGVGPLILFVVVNGAAFGRDLGAIVAARHCDRQTAAVWLRASRGDRLLLGSAMAALFLVPFLNLIAPLLGAAAITHLFHRATRTHIAA